jgi:trigger factor
VRVSENCADSEIAGKTIQARFKVHSVLRREFANEPAKWAELAGYSSIEEMRAVYEDRLRTRLEQMTYEDLREQIVTQLLDVVPFDLPEELVKQQTERELRRRAVDLIRAGYSQEDIQPHLNVIAREAQTRVVRLLREHFLLERLAEEEKIEASEADIEDEIQRIAKQIGVSPRQVRADLEQEEAWDVLRNAIIERKMIEEIVKAAEITEKEEVLAAPEELGETALDLGIARRKPAREESSE